MALYKFFKDHPKPNVFPGPYTGGISKSFYPTGFVDSNHPTDDGPIAKIVGLGWYITVAGEDALDAVMKPYIESISSFNLGKFPARDYTATGTMVQSQSIQSYMPISIKPSAISITADIAHTIQVANLNGKLVYKCSGRSAGTYSLPHLKQGVYLVKVIAGKTKFTDLQTLHP